MGEVPLDETRFFEESSPPDLGNDPTSIFYRNETSLPRPLRFLFVLNGATEGLPDFALMSLINDRIQIPVAYLPIYYGVAFLPYSLKPFYAMVSRSMFIQRHWLLVFNLFGSSTMFVFTALLGANQVILCILIAFLRGMFTSFAEFIVGITLVATAKLNGTIDVYGKGLPEEISNGKQKIFLSSYQSQAATSRNIGSFLAQIVTFFIILMERLHQNHNDDDSNTALQDSWVSFLLVLTASLPMIGAAIALYFQVGRHFELRHDNYQNVNHTAAERSFEDRYSDKTLWFTFRWEIICLILFQIIMVALALQSLIIQYSNTWIWYIGIMPFVGTFAYGLKKILENRGYMNIASNSEMSERRFNYLYRLGFYLMIRHSVPSPSGIQASFTYSLFRLYPLYYQSIGLIRSMMAVLSSWSYGNYIALRFSSVSGLKKVITTTTLILSCMGLLYVPFMQYFRAHYDDIECSILLLYTFYQLLESYVGQLSFLPSVILASESTVQDGGEHNSTLDKEMGESGDDTSCAMNDAMGTNDLPTGFPENTLKMQQNDAILYGVLIGCIDFGDQIADLISVPIVQALNIERDEKWDNLEWFIVICSTLSMASLLALRIL